MADLEMDQEYEEMEFVAVDERRYIVLVIYDIVDNKRRSRMVKCVERYGVRVQKSAFEAFLSKKKYERLVEETSRLIDLDTDSLRIYLLADHTSVRSWGVGDRHVEDVIIFWGGRRRSCCKAAILPMTRGIGRRRRRLAKLVIFSMETGNRVMETEYLN
ncbi:CRISPR-associated endonuclease Cas2 [uncultured Selenomonas sp.]|uniref:CRISPR-associated endonuclease Cas2 n=1 Tax=uncultured Selenomonas sp. TaxID=159275 RepID=UPI0028DB8EBE|nr:CRISPR-associated endonuclease Cas2 [uncultured Selenomonas sp.]